MSEVRPLTDAGLPDLAELFESNSTTKACWCMWFCSPRARVLSRWYTGGNRVEFENLSRVSDTPIGLVAYTDDEPVGWLSIGPRSRYVIATSPRSKIMRNRDPAEDDSVWLAACFFVRVGQRGQGLTPRLLGAGVEFARASGALALEGWPRSGSSRRQADLYFGRESIFATAGFEVIDRPTEARAVMRMDFR
jgi:hypothetical protein